MTQQLYCVSPCTGHDGMTGKEVIQKLQAAGWVLDRSSGSHPIMYRPGHLPVSVPVQGNRDLGIGLLKSIKRITGVTLRS